MAVAHAQAAAGMAAAAATAASPLHIRHSSFFHLPTKKRKQNRVLEQHRSEQAALQEEASLRAQAWMYLGDFLNHSMWSDQLDQIAIVRDAVPTMPELNSYGDLDEKEGTRACRRLFKAVVVWDELGHSLWKTLRAASEQRRLAQRQFELSAAPPSGYPDDIYQTSRRSSRRTSQDSCASRRSNESTLSASAVSLVDKIQRTKLSKKLSCSSSASSSASMASSRRTSCETDPPAGPGHCACCQVRRGPDTAPPADSEPSRSSAIPKIISHNCASAVRRTLGVFGESRTSLSTGWQPR